LFFGNTKKALKPGISVNDVLGELSEGMHGELVPLLSNPSWDRHKTALSSRDLIQRLANGRNGLEMVEVLESAPSDIKDEVLARSLAQAGKVVTELSHPGWKVAMDNLRSVTFEPFAQAARGILADVDEAFHVNELTRELVPALHKAMEEAGRILGEANRAIAPTTLPGATGPIRPPLISSSPIGATLKKTVAHGAQTVTPKDLDGIFQEIQSQLPSTGDAKITLSWEIVAEE
jgi:hypothetical protein